MPNQLPSVSSLTPAYTSSSIVRALDNFLKSVDKMRHTVMVPSRLKDTDVSVLPVLRQQYTNSALDANNNSNSKGNINSKGNGFNGLLQSSGKSVSPVIESGKAEKAELKKLPTSTTTTAPATATSNSNSPDEGRDLFAFYRILHTIHQELTCGKSDTDFDADHDGNDDETQKLRAIFRHHLHGMFNALQRLTDAADQMSDHYEQRIDGSADPNPSSTTQ